MASLTAPPGGAAPVEPRISDRKVRERAPASNSAREEEEAYAAAAYDEDRNEQTDTMALRRSLEGSQVALRRLAADLGSTNTTVAPAPPPPPPQDALRRARAPDIIAVDDGVSPAARDGVAFDAAPADPRSPRPDRSPAFAASIKRPAFFADEEAFRPGGPVQHTPPRSPVQREVFARLRRGRGPLRLMTVRRPGRRGGR